MRRVGGALALRGRKRKENLPAKLSIALAAAAGGAVFARKLHINVRTLEKWE
jgi:hypothetical protein